MRAEVSRKRLFNFLFFVFSLIMKINKPIKKDVKSNMAAFNSNFMVQKITSLPNLLTKNCLNFKPHALIPRFLTMRNPNTTTILIPDDRKPCLISHKNFIFYLIETALISI